MVNFKLPNGFEHGLAKKGSYELMEGGLSEYHEINSSSSYCVPAKKVFELDLIKLLELICRIKNF